MPAIGPTLPPHLAKRKYDDEEESPRSKTPESSEKRRRIIGPAPPPAPLEERPSKDAGDEEDESSDDGFGPAIPTGGTTNADYDHVDDSAEPQGQDPNPEAKEKPKGMAWMYDPQGQDDLIKRAGLDPSRVVGRARGFNQHTSPPSNDNSWNETPEQRRKRLENEVLGIKTPSTTASRGTGKKKDESSRKIKESVEKRQEKSLMEMHEKSKGKDKEDDPSKRKFDYEKDIGGVRIGNAAKRDMITRAKDFGSKFSGGGYL